MDILAYLRAGTYGNVAVDHCTLSYIGSHVDISGRHHDNARSKISTAANAAAAGNNPDPVRSAEPADRIGILVKERKLSLTHIADFSETETRKDNLLDLPVDLPNAVNLLGDTYLSGLESGNKFFELL